MQGHLGKLAIRAKPSRMPTSATVVTVAMTTVLVACLQGSALAMMPNPFDCIGNVRCASDPCASPPKCAAAVPDAICLPNYCTGQEWDGEPFPACAALWRDPATNTIIEDCVSGAGGGDEAGGDEGGPDDGCNCRGLKTAGPVCATAVNLTYASACEATCAGVTVFEDGACAVEGEHSSCFELFAPVCATAANKTYANDCFAGIAGVTKYTKGICGSIPDDETGSCHCEGDILDPVCATAANKTYSSPCEAKCAGVTVTEKGACSVEQGPRPCTREFNPVCAAGVANYSNPCMAKAAGVTEYTIGLCGTGGGKPGDGCACDGASGPVCATAANLTYASACEATCAGVTVFEDGACPVEGEPRGCIDLFDPVCATAANKTYSNSCFAAVAGVTKYTKGICGSSTDDEEGSCHCEGDIPDPVCATAANKTYSSPCEAKCAGVTVIVDGACAVEQGPRPCTLEFNPVCAAGVANYSNPCVAKAAGVTEYTMGLCGTGGGKPGVDCACDGASGPVCATAANLTYASACQAKCAGVTVFEEGACAVEGEPRGCITLFAPVCATAANKTYSNSCFAAIAGVTKYTKGACGSDTGDDDGGCPCDELVLQPVCATAANKTYSSSCQAKCAGVTVTADGACPVEGEPRFCITLFDPVCAAGVKTYGNGCEAGAAGVTESTPGACNGDDDDDPWAKCPTNKTVECFANPCDVNSCPVHPDATCMSNYCVGRVYRGRVLGPCEALFLDADGEPLMDCKDCSKCPLDYEPVCTTDGTTYPNRCSAECSGKRVKRDGKCIKCLGNSCIGGSFNEICRLGSKQCGKFLSCVLPGGGKPGPTDVFGRCRPQMVIGKGRRRSLHASQA